MNLVGLEVYVVPLEHEQLAPAQASRYGQQH
jgi:hypothetical protein